MDRSVRIATLWKDLEARIAALRKDMSAVAASRARVEAALGDGNAYYSINTGFGILADKRIPSDQLEKLQRNLILSHSVGVGDPIPREISRLILLLKIHALGQGYSGISIRTFERLLAFAERDLVPIIPRKGSVGASGDLAPLAHMSLPLIGHGEFWCGEGESARRAPEVLSAHGMEPIELQAKDGLALINGTQMMAGYGAYVLNRALVLEKSCDLIAAMSLEALQGSIRPFDARIHELRPFAGQTESAANVRKLIEGSQILETQRASGKVQDPYCLRCVPQVHGASRDALRYARGVLETEINSVTDNPLVFDNGDIVSGGNFHGQPLALALDFAAMALSELASISERRCYLLLEGEDGLPRLLMKDTGVNSGFMIPQYTAAALVSENKVLCHPASVDSIPTCLGQEDHVSMGSISATKLKEVFENVAQVLAIELFTVAQALDYRKPLRPGRGIEVAHDLLRKIVPHSEEDHIFKDELGLCHELITSGKLVSAVEEAVGCLG